MSPSSRAPIVCSPVTINTQEREPLIPVPAPSRVESGLIEADQEWWLWRFDMELSKGGIVGEKSLTHLPGGTAREFVISKPLMNHIPGFERKEEQS
jgi:hypothetical protein